jgi:hypothetical protein
MQPLKAILAGAIIAAWFSWDFSVACVRTFILGHTCEEQMRSNEEDRE